ncbi:MAG TPA: glutamine amidotransferase, partial [Bryobacteraceae bacterium]|nr:glutamine amidotransferase [Bryobacteraceae bacterium]
MFEFLFKYPAAAFAKGEVVLLGRWPSWLLAIGIVVAALLLAWPFWRRRKANLPVKPVALWLLQTLLVALLLVVLWQPALSVATLKPQQNIVAVLVDDSKSMSIREDGKSRMENVVETLRANGTLENLEKKFQVRLYRTGASLERIGSVTQLKGEGQTTRLGDSLKQIVNEASSLPIGAVVLLSDGADNSGGIDLPTITEVKRHRIPVHTIGFGREKPSRDIELLDVQLPARVLADSRIAAQVTLRTFGYESRKARILIKDGEKILASREVALKADGSAQNDTLVFSAGAAGARSVQASIAPLEGEENLANNSSLRLVNVDGRKPRVLHIEGEPVWEYKFIRRAIDPDKGLTLVSMLRTTQNKIYRQGVSGAAELQEGFPATVDELFGYDAVIIGAVEANYFTNVQQELLRQFVDRRGGGLLFLGGRSSLADGGWSKSSIADLLPVTLPERRGTFVRDPANVELTPEGRDSLLCRLEETPERNVERWKTLPYLQNYQDTGSPKAGAVVLAQMKVGNKRMPLLVTQNYGRGRTALFATSGSWRWQMSQPVQDMSHEMFWQQLVRWTVSGTMGQVISSTPKSVFSDERRVTLKADVRDK